MTCIIGYVDKASSSSSNKPVVWLGGDSCGSGNGSDHIYKNNKVFHYMNNPNIIMGGTTSFRHLDLLETTEGLFDDFEDLENITRLDIVKHFIPRVQKVFQSNYLRGDDTDRGGNFLLGINDKLFEIQNDYSVLEPDSGIIAVGCGEDTAIVMLDAYNTLTKEPPQTKLFRTLEYVSNYNQGVKPPFTVINTQGQSFVY